MADTSLVNEHQPSLSEWLEAIGHARARELREEDLHKRDRLEILRQRIGLDYDRVTKFPAIDFYARTSDVQPFIDEHGHDLCALRLVPRDPNLPKYRTRGRTLNDSLDWLEACGIDPTKYAVEFVEHSDTAQWSTIFVVRHDGVFGQIVDGLHYQLTQGNIEEGRVARAFMLNPDGSWRWSEHSAGAQEHVEEILRELVVESAEMRQQLAHELGAGFTADNRLIGYFETLLWPTKLLFIDYNRELPHLVGSGPDLAPIWYGDRSEPDRGLTPPLFGTPSARGSHRGTVRVCSPEKLNFMLFNDGDILVADNTDVRFLPFMKRAGAIVTERGGMLSHAAITARELGVPCVVGVKGLLAALQDGMLVEVDGGTGVITRL
ncbi:MAG: Phosphoenolpyruvate synthase [Parcubacteria group bacterium GW2011_GWA2_56_7]|nr:MAG: Phosphoenolpyruvate synthase [Parcubacteria group bacterium GW2011_GWA2_56_7]